MYLVHKKILEYKNERECLRKNVDKNEIRRLESFKQQETKLRLKGNTKNTIYISKEGLFNLILESKSKGAKKFKKWISKILDKIDDGEDIYEQDDIKNDFNDNNTRCF